MHDSLDPRSRFATLCHELAHIYFGHLGGDGDGWWPSRINLDQSTVEIEAEAVAYIVSIRLGLHLAVKATWVRPRAGLLRRDVAARWTNCVLSDAARSGKIARQRAEVYEITYTLAPVIIATENVWHEAGFDAKPYDFASALDEALSNPACFRRWRDRKSAFSKAIVAKDWDEANRAVVPPPPEYLQTFSDSNPAGRSFAGPSSKGQAC